MKFVQLIEIRTKHVDEIQKLEDEWEQATEGRRTLRKSIVGRDRNDPDRHIVIAFFDDYDSAMANSNLPETQAFGEKQSALEESRAGLGRAVAERTAELKMANAALSAEDERRRLFLAEASHELRMPVTIIRGEEQASALVLG